MASACMYSVASCIYKTSNLVDLPLAITLLHYSPPPIQSGCKYHSTDYVLKF